MGKASSRRCLRQSTTVALVYGSREDGRGVLVSIENRHADDGKGIAEVVPFVRGDKIVACENSGNLFTMREGGGLARW